MAALDKIARHLGFYGEKKQEAGGAKQEVFAVSGETRDEDKKEDVLLDNAVLAVNDNGLLVSDKAAEMPGATANDGVVNEECALIKAGKILTLSPLDERSGIGNEGHLSVFDIEKPPAHIAFG